MLLALAWRNLWRNSRRSLIILVSVIVGLVAIILYDSLSVGMIRQMLDNQIGSHVAHIQIHRRGFRDNPIVQNFLPGGTAVEKVLKATPGIRAFSRRIITYGILSSPYASSGVSLVGINPEEEAQVTKIRSSLLEGHYLSGKPHEIVIGQKLAEKLDVGLGDKVVAMASALSGSIGSDVFRVVGIFQTFSSEFDKSYTYIPMESASNMIELGGRVSEVAVIVTDLQQLERVKQALLSGLRGESAGGAESPYEVFTFRDLLPLLVMQMDLYQETVFIFYAIIGLAMIFGIVNTMLMSVFERIQEFGVLMAVGMKAGRLFLLVILEAFLLGLLGSAIGFLLGYLIYIPLSSTGVDLRMFSEGLHSLGVGAIIYPVLTPQGIISALLIIPLISVLGALYPAIKAVRLQPVEAIRFS